MSDQIVVSAGERASGHTSGRTLCGNLRCRHCLHMLNSQRTVLVRSVAAFIAAFSKQFGVTPGRYLRR